MKINVTTLGCPKNIVDSEFLLGGLQGKGVELVADPMQAETIILNTCGFIQGAKEESLEAILQAVELKKRGQCRKVFVTGCLSQRYSEELKKEIPEVDGYYGNRDMQRILKQLLLELDLKRELTGERRLTTPSHFAYLKISEGCENPCTFCAIPGIRGKFQSRSIDELIREAEMLATRGVKELIIIAQDTTIYGKDRYGESKLVALLHRLSELDAFTWMRLLYTYPAHFSDDIVEAIAEHQNVLQYVDMPIQHISDRLLKRMARKASRKRIEQIIDMLRTNVPQVTLRTSLIVGFPGEEEADHQELVEFVEKTRFERLGLFTYSKEENTPAFDFKDQIPDYLMQERWAELNDVQSQISLGLNKKTIDSVQNVVIDDYDSQLDRYIGRTVRDCPEIDNAIMVKSSHDLEVGQFYDVRVTQCSEYDLTGELAPIGR